MGRRRLLSQLRVSRCLLPRQPASAARASCSWAFGQASDENHGRVVREVRMSAIDPNLRKFHLSLNASNLERSVEFYRLLLGVEPAKVKPDYAKFDLADPPLVLSLVPGEAGRVGSLNHAGLRVRTSEELVDIQRRLERAGIQTERQDGVEFCYAKQTKFWIADPDGALWEIYVFHEDVATFGTSTAPRAIPLTAAKTDCCADAPVAKLT